MKLVVSYKDSGLHNTSLNQETARRWFQHSHMNELLKQSEGTTTVMASENGGRRMLRSKNIILFHILTIESIVLNKMPPKSSDRDRTVGPYGHAGR